MLKYFLSFLVIAISAVCEYSASCMSGTSFINCLIPSLFLTLKSSAAFFILAFSTSSESCKGLLFLYVTTAYLIV